MYSINIAAMTGNNIANNTLPPRLNAAYICCYFVNDSVDPVVKPKRKRRDERSEL